MGWSLRKSFRISKHTRLNLSSKGIGISTGVPGFRISSRGRIYGGKGALRFQKSFSSSSSKKSSGSYRSRKVEERPITEVINPIVNMGCLIFPLIAVGGLALLAEMADGSFSWFGLICLSVAAAIFFNSSQARDGYKMYQAALLENENARAVIMFEEAYGAYPNAGIGIHLAESYMNNRLWAKAQQILEKIKEKPRGDCPLVIALLGTCVLKLGKDEEALVFFERVDEKEEYEDFMSILALKAEAYYDLKQFDKAMAAVKGGLAKRSEEYVESKRELRYWLAKIYMAIGDVSKAKVEVKKLLAEVPDYGPATELLTELAKTD